MKSDNVANTALKGICS